MSPAVREPLPTRTAPLPLVPHLPYTRMVVPILLWLLFPCCPLSAQFPMSTISGSVRSEQGEPIAGARIEWIQNGQAVALLSDGNGEFSFHFATPGRHTVTFAHSSTSLEGSHDVQVEPGIMLRLSVKLCESGGDDSSQPTWEIEERREILPDAWPVERVLSERRIESLPGTAHLSSLLNHTEASVVAERFDIGGMHSHRQLRLGIRGSSWTQNEAVLNGLDIGHPAGDGMVLSPDISAMESVIYSIGGSPSRNTGPGAHLALIPKSGESTLHGQADVFFQGGALQSSNVTERYRFFGFTESDERWRHYVQGGFQLGGPLGDRPWNYFGSISFRDLEKRIRNHPLPVGVRMAQETWNLTGRISARDRLSFFWAGQQLREPQAESSPQVTRESSLDQKRVAHAAQASWTRVISARSLLDVRFGAVLGRVISRFQPGVVGQSQEDLFPGHALFGVPDAPHPLKMVEMLSNTRRGPAPQSPSSDSGSLEGSVAFATVRSLWNAQHRLEMGASYQRMSLTQESAAMEGVNLLFFDGAANSVRILNFPARTRDRIRQLELRASDGIAIRRFSVGLGVSVQCAGGASILRSGRSVNNRNWVNVAGRIGVAFRVTERFPLVLRAGAARIFNQPLASAWTAANPEGPGANLYSWSDENQDRRFQAGENLQILKVYGSPYTQMNEQLRNPRTVEYTIGLTQGGLRGIAVSVFGFHRAENQLMSLVNEGVPFSSYAPVQVPDPGPDGEVGSEDDRWITVFNQKMETLGADRFLLTNPAGLSGYSEGMEFKVTFSFRRFQAEAALTRYRAVAATGPGISAQENDTSALQGVYDDPNKAVFARGSSYFDRGTLGRVWAAVPLLWNIQCSLIGSYQDGLPYARYLPVQGLNQGIVGVLTSQRGPGEAGSKSGSMTSHYETYDLRLRREFPLRRGTVVAVLDAFNVANRSQPLVQAVVTAPTQYWRIPLRFETPRSLQLGIRFKW
jgi:hypothetical protein